MAWAKLRFDCFPASKALFKTSVSVRLWVMHGRGVVFGALGAVGDTACAPYEEITQNLLIAGFDPIRRLCKDYSQLFSRPHNDHNTVVAFGAPALLMLPSLIALGVKALVETRFSHQLPSSDRH